MFTFLVFASLLNGEGVVMMGNRPATLMVGIPNGQVMSWSSTDFRSFKDCQENGQAIAQVFSEEKIPAELYCTPSMQII